MFPLLQAREQFVDVVLAFADFRLGVEKTAHVEVLFNGQAGKHAPAFGHDSNARAHDVRCEITGDVPTLENHPARGGLGIPADGHQQRGLAGAIGTDQRHDLTFFYFDRDTVKCLDLAVMGMDVF